MEELINPVLDVLKHESTWLPSGDFRTHCVYPGLNVRGMWTVKVRVVGWPRLGYWKISLIFKSQCLQVCYML